MTLIVGTRILVLAVLVSLVNPAHGYAQLALNPRSSAPANAQTSEPLNPRTLDPPNPRTLSAVSFDCASRRPAAIRPMRPWIRRVMSDMAARSPTLRALVHRAERSGTIIHVDEAREGGEWDGRLRFAGATGRYRYLRIDVRRLEAPVAAAMLAHELQHAAEVSAEPVRTPWEFSALFRRIGFAVPNRATEYYDTAAAIEAGVATLRELTGRVVYAQHVPALPPGHHAVAQAEDALAE